MERITASLDTLDDEITAHAQGYKQVFIRKNATLTKVIQVSYGKFDSEEYCELHSQSTIEEFFFFTEGKGNYVVGKESIELQQRIFIHIHAGVLHRLEAISESPLRYMYFGVATDPKYAYIC